MLHVTPQKVPTVTEEWLKKDTNLMHDKIGLMEEKNKP